MLESPVEPCETVVRRWHWHRTSDTRCLEANTVFPTVFLEVALWLSVLYVRISRLTLRKQQRSKAMGNEYVTSNQRDFCVYAGNGGKVRAKFQQILNHLFAHTLVIRQPRGCYYLPILASFPIRSYPWTHAFDSSHSILNKPSLCCANNLHGSFNSKFVSCCHFLQATSSEV